MCRIGEISLMKDLTKTMEISMREMEEQEAAAAEAEKVEASGSAAAPGQTDATTGAVPAAGPADTTSAPSAAAQADAASGHAGAHVADAPPASSVPQPASAVPVAEPSTATGANAASPASGPSGAQTRNIPIRAAIMDKSEEDARMEAAGMTDAEKELREKQKKKAGLTKEQREELAAYEQERKKIREERIENLSKKLTDYISVWTETDKAKDVTAAFRQKIQLEIENLKMESFGLEILHAIGTTYTMKASSFLKSQKFLGISGFFSRIKDKGTLVKDTWSTMSAAIDAQLTMEEMAKLEEAGGEAWTDEKKAEYEKRVTGKILAAAWRGSKFEIQSVLRDVCDSVLNDKKVKLEKRVERAQALMVVGEMFQKVSNNTMMPSIDVELTVLRLNAILKKKVTLWRSNNSWPKRPRRRRTSTRSTTTTRRTRRRRRKRRKRRHERRLCLSYLTTISLSFCDIHRFFDPSHNHACLQRKAYSGQSNTTQYSVGFNTQASSAIGIYLYI
jgi:hypothetical protein